MIKSNMLKQASRSVVYFGTILLQEAVVRKKDRANSKHWLGFFLLYNIQFACSYGGPTIKILWDWNLKVA